MNPDLKKIKKLYGEKMMQLCRTHFATILEEPGKLVELMTNNFEPNRSLYEDIVKNKKEQAFKNFIINSSGIDEKKQETNNKTVKELMSEAGYDFFECKTEEEIQNFRHYYEEDEELCTFWTYRLTNCYVFFAVKKDVDEIKRENFSNPKRQDRYGTSVISIQFTRNDSNTLSIKNRYNHTVQNPDATFSNNLENIIPGLTKAFERDYGLKPSKKAKVSFELPGYVKASDEKFYKYNYEIDNIYYCSNNVVIDNFNVKKLEKEKYIVMDCFTLDLVNKKMTINENSPTAKMDSFIDEFNDIDKINVVNTENGNKEIKITTKTNHEIIIGLDKYNRIISYHNPRVEEIKDNFLRCNEVLKNISLPNLKKVGGKFLHNNKDLTTISLPNLEEVGYKFLSSNKILEEVNLPNLKRVGSGFLCEAALKKLSLPCLEEAGSHFLIANSCLETIDLPKLKKADDFFMRCNNSLKTLILPCLEEVGHCFIEYNHGIETVELLNLKKVKSSFLGDNKKLKSLVLPSLEEADSFFLSKNKKLKELIVPKLKKVGDYFLSSNKGLTAISLPLPEEIGNAFLEDNIKIKEINLPNLKKVGNRFLAANKSLISLFIPNLEEAGSNFLESNEDLEEIDLPKLKKAGDYFLSNNKGLKSLPLLLLEKVGDYFLSSNESIEEVNIPNLKSAGVAMLMKNKSLIAMSLPSLEETGVDFMSYNRILTSLSCPKLREIKARFLDKNRDLSYLDISSVEQLPKKFLAYAKNIKEMLADKLPASKKEELSQRFNINDATIEEQNYEPKIYKTGEVYNVPIAKVEKSSNALTSKINAGIRTETQILSSYKDIIEIGGISK